MNNDLKQESHGDQSPNIATSGPVSIIYNNQKTAIGVVALVVVLAIVAIVFASKRGTHIETEGGDVVIQVTAEGEGAIAEMLRARNVPEGYLADEVARASELLSLMQVAIIGYDDGVRKALAEGNLEGAKADLSESYSTNKRRFERASDPGIRAEIGKRVAAEAFVLGGIYLLQLDPPQAARNEYEKAVELAPGNDMYLTELGRLEFEMHEYEKAGMHFEQALKIRQDKGEQIKVTASLNNLGWVSSRLRQDDEAIEYFERARDVRAQLGDELGVAAMHNNLGLVYGELGDYEASIGEFRKALSIYRKEFKGDENHRAVANTYENLAVSCYEKAEDGALCREDGEGGDDLQAALHYHDKALSIRRAILQPNHPEVAKSLFNLGNVWEAKSWIQEYDGSAGAAESMETAIGFYDESKAILSDSLGPDHADTVKVVNYLLDLEEALDDEG